MPAHIILTPKIHIRGDRAAEVLGISLEQADKLLSQPDTKSLIQTALEQSFQETVDSVLRGMTRVPILSVPSIRVDCAVDLPVLPAFKAGFGF
jgi:hypothetical protein